MRHWCLRQLTFAGLCLVLVAGHASEALGQTASPRALPLPLEPLLPTRLEALLASPNLVLVADYYRIDMRFGPSLRVDAVIIEAVDTHTRVKGLRVQVRDPESRGRQEGTSYIDIDELTRLARGVTTMAELATKWTLDDRQATELTFTTGGGFRLAIRHSARVPRAYISTGLLDPVVTSLDIAELPTLRQVFDQALAILNSK
ncbi:MAG TPA: hypothetical protein VKH34_14195 [Vicinamibacterales bacterium]|nr:hypothetical protein [Vicinamibacterales bacterium]